MLDIKTIETHHGVTWERLGELEPALEALLAVIQAARPLNPKDKHFQWEIVWGQFKDRIATLVGFHRRDLCDPLLKTIGAYEVAYAKLWHALYTSNRKSIGGARC